MELESLTGEDRRFGLPECAALLLFAACVAWLTLRHDAWADEAQAWLLARDNSFTGMLQQVHYEGTPALWHILLWIETRLHVSYGGMHWINAGVGVLSAFVLLRYSPFPRWAKLMLPFSSFLLFHASVVARSYGLAILLMFVLAALYRSKPQKIVLGCFLCGLLANVSLFTLFVGVGFSGLFILRAYRAKRGVATTSLFIFLLLLTFAIQQAIPAPDTESQAAGDLNRHAIAREMFSILSGIPVNPEAVRWAEDYDAQHPAEHAAQRGAARNLVTYVEGRASLMLHAAIFTVSSSAWLSLVFLGVLAWWLLTNRRLAMAAPLTLLLAGGALLSYSEHHMLLLWAALVITLWLAWPVRSVHPYADRALCLLLLTVCLCQVAWSVHALRLSRSEAFDGGRQLAQFLGGQPRNERIATVTYYAVSSQPYLRRNPFNNVPTSYWPWAIGKEPALNLDAVLRERPDRIVAPFNKPGPAIVGNALHAHAVSILDAHHDKILGPILAHGYREAHRFCGQQPMQFSYSEEDCLVVLQREPL